MINKHYKNISNYFSLVDDVGKAFEWIMNTDSEAIFGVEVELEGGAMGVSLVTPPYIRLGQEACITRLVDCEESFACYEGYLVEPHFLPLYGALNGLLMNDLENLELGDEEAVALQWLFRRRADNWKPQTVQMYSSFLEGNEDPFPSRIGRAIQDKVLGLLNKMTAFDTSKPYIEEVEEKLLQACYQFQLRVIVKSPEPKNIKYRLVEIFKKYDSHNAIRLLRVKPKRFVPFYRDVVLTYDTGLQILSRSEVASLFGGKVPAVDIVPVAAVESVPEKKASLSSLGITELLPYYPREVVEVSERIVTDIAEAMKRAGVIHTARLYNPKVTSGVRLTVVQTDIPNNKTLTQLANNTKDIQAELGVLSLGIEQGSDAGTVKFTIPNEEPAIISLRELIELDSFRQYAKENDLAFVVGVDEINNPIYLSLSKLVHLLIAGTTGSGKSVFVNTMVICLIANHTPEELRLLMIDPKQVELQHYEGFPHVREVITDMENAAQSLEKLVETMELRYTQFKEVGVKNIKLYNQKMENKIPYIVCVIDEYADLKDTHPQVEDHITRLGQKARAAGIHMVIATQRPDVKVVSGRIKANVPNAISFNLGSNVHYKTVFGRGIPYSQLLGRGDGVMKIEGYPKEFQRFQSAIISPDELLEEEIFNSMKEYLSGAEIRPTEETEDVPEVVAEENLVEKLKDIIITTGETKIEALRKELGVKNTTVIELMNQLVEEGFLIKHKSKVKGYEVNTPE